MPSAATLARLQGRVMQEAARFAMLAHRKARDAEAARFAMLAHRKARHAEAATQRIACARMWLAAEPISRAATLARGRVRG